MLRSTYRASGLVLAVVVAACGASGPPSGTASLSGVTPAGKSASASSFTGANAAGTMVLGWTIDFFSQGPGADCASNDTEVVASVAIFTSQAPDSTHKIATLETGDISITTESPPSVPGNAAANMGGKGVSGIAGVVSISAFVLKPDMSLDHIQGMVNAAGTDANSASTTLTGSFTAPFCN